MSEPDGPRFSLPVADGAGALLGLAGGDSAGGTTPGGYSAVTQQAVVIAYHLLRHGAVAAEVLATELAILDGEGDEPSVYRGASEALRRWLDSSRHGEAVHSTEDSAEPAARVAPIGMWFRRDPAQLVSAALDSARLTHLDGPSAVASAAAAAAVAASCFAQNGRDLLMAVADVAARAAGAISSQELRFARLEAMDDVVTRFRGAVRLIGEPARVVFDQAGQDAVGVVVAALTIAAPVSGQPHLAVEDAARSGGSVAGALAGAVVGARTGVRRWPWDIPNDSWFVALGHRLAAGARDLADLPVPYAVEQRLTYASETGRL